MDRRYRSWGAQDGSVGLVLPRLFAQQSRVRWSETRPDLKIKHHRYCDITRSTPGHSLCQKLLKCVHLNPFHRYADLSSHHWHNIKMPRPKRSKVAPSAPAQLPAKLIAALRAADAPSSPQRPDTATQKLSSNSDDSEGIVKRNASGANRRGVKRKDVYTTGALPAEQKPSGINSKRQALAEIGTKNVAVERQREGKACLLQASLGHGLEREETIVPSSMPDTEEPTKGISLGDTTDVPATTRKSITQKSSMPSANWRAQATPRLDSSVLALGNFKRRSRQPSILGIGQPDESPSMDSFDLGVDDSMGDLSATRGKAADTPLQRMHTAIAATVDPNDTLSEAGRNQSLFPSSRKRKRSSPKILVQHSQSPTTSEADRIFGSDEDSAILNIPLPAKPETEKDGEPELPTFKSVTATPPEAWSDTMALPQSSSPSQSPSKRTVSKLPEAERSSRLPKGRPKRTSAATTKRPRTRNKDCRPLGPLSTATLQSLLPRRRTKHVDEFDLSSNSGTGEVEMTAPAEDEDELGFVPVRVPKKLGVAKSDPRRKKQPVKTPLRSVGKPDTGKTVSKSKAPKQSELAGTSKAVSSPKHQRKTYTRAVQLQSKDATYADSHFPSSGIDGHDSIADLTVLTSSSSDVANIDKKIKKEMKSLSRKFREVDEWEMEFESAGASSSPWDAR